MTRTKTGGLGVRDLTDEMVVDHCPPAADTAPPRDVHVPGRHVAEVARHPDGRLAVITWSSPEIDPGLLHPALHVIRDGEITDLGPTPADAGKPVWWNDEVCYLALTPPHLQGGNAVFDQHHRNLTEGLPGCPTDLIQDDGHAPIMVVATGLDTEFHRLGHGLLGRITGAHRPRGGHADQLGDVEWGVQERLRYRARDGLDLDGLLVLPPNKTRRDGPFPLITLIHGGPYDRWSDDFQLHWVPSAQWFAHQGFASFLPNPRGSLGRGHEFAAAVAGRVGQEEWHDVETGIDLLVEQGVADPDRLGISGWSHGGFMAAWATTRTDRFKAALVGAGISDWPKLIEKGEWGTFEAALGDSPEHSPLTYADRIRTPLLIVHGAEDTNVPLEQAELLHRAVRHSELVVYPGEGHSLKAREHRLDLLNRARRLFATL
ncbi:prolyl oligopeptidase family serine peptidase [Lentzea sp. NPDC005914]|uniref:alpha/beta hydrolase family protein n=1 Tax=Lentzea sp. NPDC005914 TaxID=3154572 RepID=UPI00340EB8D5